MLLQRQMFLATMVTLLLSFILSVHAASKVKDFIRSPRKAFINSRIDSNTKKWQKAADEVRDSNHRKNDPEYYKTTPAKAQDDIVKADAKEKKYLAKVNKWSNRLPK